MIKLKKVIRDGSVFGMANLNPKKTNLSLVIWADHNGVSRKVPHHDTPRVKIGNNDYNVAVLISDDPRILAKFRKLKSSELDKVNEAIKYVARNNDIFLAHYFDTDFTFDDEDLFSALRDRGEYK